MKLKLTDRLINNSDIVTYILVAFMLITILIGGLKIIFF